MRGMLGNFTAENSHGKIDKRPRLPFEARAAGEPAKAPPGRPYGLMKN
jgi:hypothetical protein